MKKKKEYSCRVFLETPDGVTHEVFTKDENGKVERQMSWEEWGRYEAIIMKNIAKNYPVQS